MPKNKKMKSKRTISRKNTSEPSSIRVILDKDIKENPQCQHGPTILFERRFQNAEKTYFYACAAFRDRKQCPFYILKRDLEAKNNLKSSSTTNLRSPRKKYVNNPTGFCKTCPEIVS